jgi:hypothetical protein
VKSEEERQAEKRARVEKTKRPAAGREEDDAQPAKSPSQTKNAFSGLELSAIQLKPLSFLKDHPANAIFEKLKTDEYYDHLREDIVSTQTLIEPILIMPDGLILSGYSRRKIIKEEIDEGRGFGKPNDEGIRPNQIPTRTCLTPLTDEEIVRRIYLGNMTRFEIDTATRLYIASQLWPQYYLKDTKKGKKGEAALLAQVAASEGKSERQTQRDKNIIQAAADLAGGLPPEPEHIAAAQEELAEERRTNTKQKSPESVSLSQMKTELKASTKKAEQLSKAIEKMVPASELKKANDTIATMVPAAELNKVLGKIKTALASIDKKLESATKRVGEQNKKTYEKDLARQLAFTEAREILRKLEQQPEPGEDLRSQEST